MSVLDISQLSAMTANNYLKTSRCNVGISLMSPNLDLLFSSLTNPFTAASTPAVLYSLFKENVVLQVLRESFIFFIDHVTIEIKSLL